MLSRHSLLPLIAVSTVVCGWSAQSHASVVSDNPFLWTRTFIDDFDGTSLDTTKWGYRKTGVRNNAINTPNAVVVGDGALKIKTYTDNGLHYTGMIGTENLFQQTYGYFEAKIKFNSTPGQWSAFWMQSPTIGTPVGNTAVAGSEIDIVEQRAVDGSGNDISNRVHNAVHWDGYDSNHKVLNNFEPAFQTPGMSNGSWHVYGLSWTPAGYNFYWDDKLIWTVADAVSMRSEYMILSSEIIDGSWAGKIPAGGYGSFDTTTTDMQVDYVRAFTSNGVVVPAPEPTSLAAFAVVGGLLMKRRRR